MKEEKKVKMQIQRKTFPMLNPLRNAHNWTEYVYLLVNTHVHFTLIWSINRNLTRSFLQPLKSPYSND